MAPTRRPHLRTLYWRAVFGFSACIAAVLILQVAAVVLYLRGTLDPQQLKAFGGVGIVVRQSWRELIGWKMTLLSISLFVVATLIATRFVFGTVVSRIGNVVAAATRCGAGDFSVRADTSGRDELSDLGFAFNRMAEALGRRDEQLQAADRTRRMLLADISHELRTPLTSVRSYRDVLSMSEVGGHPEAVRCLRVIDDETRRLEQLIGDLLDLARLEAAPYRLTHEAVSVEHLFGAVISRLEPQGQRRGIALTTSIATGAELVYGDPLRLEQAVQNLAANALRHTPAGGAIAMSAAVQDRSIVLTVRDTGRGIPAAHLPFVFDRFYKVDSARSHVDESGSGLGLSIVKAIVEGHGGRVAVASLPDVETTFTIHLPLDRTARSPFVAA